MRGLGLGVLACLGAVMSAAWAAPFVPADPNEVVERLPLQRATLAERQAQRRLREQLAAAPSSLPMAVQAARAALQRARVSGDPRELGEAQAALAPWWPLPSPPPVVRLLRATVWQGQHRFDAALRDLDALVSMPATPVALQAQAVLTRTSVLQVVGRWGDAAVSCAQLQRPTLAPLGEAVAVPARVCEAELASLRGAPAASATALQKLSSGLADAGTRRWVSLVRAELAERLGDAHAGALYQSALGETPELYTLAAYADWLLAHDRPRDAAALLNGRDEADALLLRLAIAWHRLGDARAADAARTLQARFDAAALRNDTTHRREQARFELDVRGDARAALPHALANWAAQKEPADTLLLVRTAAAAKAPAAAEPVWQFMRDTGYADVRLATARDGAWR